MAQRKSPRLKSKAHRKGKMALLIIDMINTLEFPEGRALKRFALPVAKRIAKLKTRFHRRGLPVIYVNDNFDEWIADWRSIYEKCASDGALGCEIARLLEPSKQDFFILKPKHSAFHQTPLEILLEKLHVKKLVITGIAGDICVLFAAHDAHMRGFDVTVPWDAIASNSKAQNQAALTQLKKGLKLRAPASRSLP